MFFEGIANLGGYDNTGIGLLVMSLSASIVGGVLVTIKLVKLLSAFVDAND